MKISWKHRVLIFLVDLISRTWRIRCKVDVPKPSIIAFWHGKMLPVWKFFAQRGAYAVVSLSKDGEILSRLLKRWGYNLIRGSSSKGGKEVLDEIIEKAKDNFVLITPDGPQGPANVFKAGAVVASVRSQTKLVLCGVHIKWQYNFRKSWDNFAFPLPFAKIELVFSAPIKIDKDAPKDRIEELINVSNVLLNNLND